MSVDPAPGPRPVLARVRIATQIAFFLFFAALLVQARFNESDPGAVPPLSTLFLESDAYAGLSAALAARRLAALSLWGVGVLVLTFALGRVFCGWICPLGTAIDGGRRLLAPKADLANTEADLRRWRRVKYGLLVATAFAALLGANLAGLFSPIAILTRVFTALVFPLIALLVSAASDFAVWTGREGFIRATDSLYAQTATFTGPSTTTQGLAILALFGGILILERWTHRFWCRHVCPLGALLGWVSSFRLLRRRIGSACDTCKVCRQKCKMGAVGDDLATNASECIVCGDCLKVCPVGALEYGFGGPVVASGPLAVAPRAPVAAEIRLSRRQFVGTAAAGAATAVVASTAYADPVTRARSLRPPGVTAELEEEFLDRCIRCGECVRVCATSGRGLTFSGVEGGWYALWSPVFRFRGGCCAFECNLCTQACPTQAIPRIDMETKQKFVIGIAFFDTARCIPYYRNTECMVCEEHCPTPDKAIKFVETEIPGEEGPIFLKRPKVDESLCIGCGICETKCPVNGPSAIVVYQKTAAGLYR